MKKITLLAFMALALCACTKINEVEEEQQTLNPDSPNTVTFTAEFTKTATANDQTVTWEAGDEVKFVWAGGSATAAASASGSSTTFSVEVADGIDELYAVYPASAGGSYDEGNVKVHFNGSRTDGSFAANDICVAKAVKNGDTWQTSLTFKNVACLFKISVTGSGYDQIQIQEKNRGVGVSGRLSVNIDGNTVTPGDTTYTGTSMNLGINGPGTYYIPVLPDVTFENGFMIKLLKKGNIVGTPFYYNGSFTTERGKILKFPDIDGHAGHYYVKPGGDGQKSGQNWSNAMDTTQFRLFVTNSANHTLLRGATFHFSAESFNLHGYLQPDFSDRTVVVDFTIEGISQGSNRTTFVGGSGQPAGSLWPKSKCDLTVKNVRFTGTNGDGNRGAIRVNTIDAKLNLKNCSFDHNSTTGNGGAICLYKGDITIEDCEFSSNSSVLGAAIYVEGATTLSVSGSTFESNTASHTTADYGGGAIYIKSQGATVEIENCTFTNNQATNKCGGAICVKNGDGNTDLTLSNCSFTDNYAKGWGGAILFKVPGNLVVTDCQFDGNYAGEDSGAINPDIATCSFTRVSFTGNHADKDFGGVMWAGNGEMTFTDCSFDGNYTTTKSGGVIYSYDNGSLEFNNCRFTGNYSNSTNNSYRGGAFAVRQGTLKFNKCIFDSNYGWKGGAISSNDGGSTIYLNDCVFTGNYSTTGYGTSIQVNNIGTTLCMNNCTFADNTYCSDGSQNGKACCWIDLLNTGKFVLSNSTLIGYSRKGENGSTNSGGAALIGWDYASTPVAFINNIIAHSNGADKGAFQKRGGTPTITAVSNKMSNFVNVTPDTESGKNATDFRGNSSCFEGLSYVSPTDDLTLPSWNNCYWSWNGTLASGSDLDFDTAANIKAAIQSADSDFYTWLGTVEGLTKDGRGHNRPDGDSAEWWPGAYQN